MLFSVVPIIEKTANVENYVGFVVNTLIDLKGLTPSIKALAYGIEWLIVDKLLKMNKQETCYVTYWVKE